MFGQKHVAIRLAWLVPCVALGLIACSETVPPTDPTISAQATGEVVSTESATAAYQKFLETSDLVLSEGGAQPERMNAVADSEALDKSLDDARDFNKSGLLLVGSTKFDSVTVQQASETSVVFYVCDDVSGTDLLNASGISLVKPDRVNRSPWLITTTLSADQTVRVSKRELWTGDNFCQG